MLDELFADLQSWARLLLDQDEMLGVSPLSSMPSVAGRKPATLWPGPATDQDVRHIIGEHLDRLEHHVTDAIGEQEDDGSRAALAEVQRGVRDHQRLLDGDGADRGPTASDNPPPSTTNDS